jgi:hypothetical protein
MLMENIETVLARFKKKFPPAASAGESNLSFTTDGIFEAIQSFNPTIVIMKEDLCDALSKLGYAYEPELGCEMSLSFRWLIRVPEKLWIELQKKMNPKPEEE